MFHLRGCFQELDVVFPGDLLAPLLADDPPVLHVALVAEDHPLHVLVGVLVDVAEPLGDVVEALGVGDVVHQHDAHGAAVVARGDRVEPGNHTNINHPSSMVRNCLAQIPTPRLQSILGHT